MNSSTLQLKLSSRRAEREAPEETSMQQEEQHLNEMDQKRTTAEDKSI